MRDILYQVADTIATHINIHEIVWPAKLRDELDAIFKYIPNAERADILRKAIVQAVVVCSPGCLPENSYLIAATAEEMRNIALCEISDSPDGADETDRFLYLKEAVEIMEPGALLGGFTLDIPGTGLVMEVSPLSCAEVLINNDFTYP